MFSSCSLCCVFCVSILIVDYNAQFRKKILDFLVVVVFLFYLCGMRVIAFSTIREFINKHSESDKPLRDWYSKVLRADWKCFADIKNDFNSVDFVGNDRYVFNIGGNKFRIVAIVIFVAHKVFMRFIGTHDEYDKIKDIQNI